MKRFKASISLLTAGIMLLACYSCLFSFDPYDTGNSLLDPIEDKWDAEDVISFSASGDNVSLLSGWCTTGDGTHYEF